MNHVPFRVERTKNRHSRAMYREGTIVIRLAKNLPKSEEERHIENLLRRMSTLVAREKKRTVIDPLKGITGTAKRRLLWKELSVKEQSRVTALVHLINESTLHVSIRSVKLRFATTQWGSCSSKGDITLNTALLFLPEYLLEYVIVHELSHRVHQNHSAAYWSTVERALPGYKDAYNELKQYRLPKR